MIKLSFCLEVARAKIFSTSVNGLHALRGRSLESPPPLVLLKKDGGDGMRSNGQELRRSCAMGVVVVIATIIVSFWPSGCALK
jgi:hypothetical protein